MSDPFIGEIRMFAGNYAPRDWSLCDGQILPVAQHSALYSLLSNIYGGDGITTFALPDFRGRIPVHAGNGPGLSPVPQGLSYGWEQVALTPDEIPSHNHPLQASITAGATASPTGAVLSKLPAGMAFITDPAQAKIVDFPDGAVAKAGDDNPHSNMMPTLCISFIIAMVGIYPS